MGQNLQVRCHQAWRRLFIIEVYSTSFTPSHLASPGPVLQQSSNCCPLQKMPACKLDMWPMWQGGHQRKTGTGGTQAARWSCPQQLLSLDLKGDKLLPPQTSNHVKQPGFLHQGPVTISGLTWSHPGAQGPNRRPALKPKPPLNSQNASLSRFFYWSWQWHIWVTCR